MGGSTGNSPCASCKLLRRRCAKDCTFAPYFPADDPHKFAIVHKVFGASNVSKMLQELPIHQRGDAVSSLVYEANARLRDPVYGCVGAISYLQTQVSNLQMQLAVAQAEILCIQMHQDPSSIPASQPLIISDHDDDLLKPYFLGHTIGTNNNNQLVHHAASQFHGFATSSPGINSKYSNDIVIHDSFKREMSGVFDGHDHLVLNN